MIHNVLCSQCLKVRCFLFAVINNGLFSSPKKRSRPLNRDKKYQLITEYEEVKRQFPHLPYLKKLEEVSGRMSVSVSTAKRVIKEQKLLGNVSSPKKTQRVPTIPGQARRHKVYTAQEKEVLINTY